MEDRIARLDHVSVDLLLYAQQQQWTTEGEMFSTNNLLQTLTDTYSVDAYILSNPSATAIITALLQGAAVLLPYDAARNHEPCCLGGEASHWAVLVGVLAPVSALRTDTGDGTRIILSHETPSTWTLAADAGIRHQLPKYAASCMMLAQTPKSWCL
jgi:hypothetical protein